MDKTSLHLTTMKAKKAPEKEVVHSLRLDQSIYDGLKKLAEREQRSLANYLKVMLRAHVEKELKK